jgi:hypothetical protein
LYELFFALLAAGVVHAAELPANVVKLIPKGFEVLSYAVGQLTDDNRHDYLAVIHRPAELYIRGICAPSTYLYWQIRPM